MTDPVMAFAGLSAVVILICGVWKVLEIAVRILRWSLKYNQGEAKLPTEQVMGILDRTRNILDGTRSKLLFFAKKKESTKRKNKKPQWVKRDK